ncbi:MAG: 2'-deoxycytidine 5'-triphosphate deaminase [Acidobacteriota bacterium]
MSAGVLNQDEIQSLIDDDPPRIKSTTAITVKADPSSIDLPIGDTYYEMRASCRPSPDYSVADLIRRYHVGRHELEPGTIFHSTKVYLVSVPWSLELPAKVGARSTARSSIGRLDTLVRLIADHQPEFDRISAGSTTSLYLEVAPITFPLKVSPAMPLSQIRFIKGAEELCILPAAALEFEDTPVLVDEARNRVKPKSAQGDPYAVLLSLDLSDDPKLGFVGFAAKQGEMEPVDPSVRKEAGEDLRYPPESFWEPVRADAETRTITIEKDRFYIFRSKERFRIPSNLCVECQAYSESLGDIRIHYAGFAHPFFGLKRAEGTPLIFEVRGHSVNTILRDGDSLAKVYFYRMTNPATEDKEQIYNNQELQLSGCFKEWPA